MIHTDDLTLAQAQDIANLIPGCQHYTLYRHGPVRKVYKSFTTTVVASSETGWEDALRRADLWPDESFCPPPHRFVAVDRAVMRAQEHVATARSSTFARRIARALNRYTPNHRGC